MAYSATNIITWAKISQVLAYYDNIQKAAQGGDYDPELHIKIKVERERLAWEYDQDPASAYLFPIGNYVFALCFPYVFKAMTISGAGGAPATPTVPGSRYVFNEIIATISSASASYTNTDLINGTDLNFILWNKQPIYVGDDFNYNNTTGTLTLLNGNTFQIGDVIVIPYNALV